MGSGWWREINDREKKNELCIWLFWYEMIKILVGKKNLYENFNRWKVFNYERFKIF